MASVKPDATIKEYQAFVKEVYGLPNDRYFSVQDMITNVERFSMRGLKGIRKGDAQKTRINLLISLSWFMSMLNQLHINIEEEVWRRFPYMCSYCAFCPCVCKIKRPEQRQKVSQNPAKRPKTFSEFQKMLAEIYPPAQRTLEHAGVHLAEEIGELSESIMTYRGNHKDEDFDKIILEAADLFSCFVGVFNSLGMDMAKEFSITFSENCHICKKAPCECNFIDITSFKS